MCYKKLSSLLRVLFINIGSTQELAGLEDAFVFEQLALIGKGNHRVIQRSVYRGE